jgi:very-short-patch-repair endonuclease
VHKRTTPKIFGRAKQLHRNMTPAEEKLWKYLRAHRMGDVHFRNQHAIGSYNVDFSPEGDDVCPAQKTHHRAGR